MNQPNLIYIFADQLRHNAVGFNGDGKAKTPNLDKLAENSLNVCNAVSGHPVCAPYRASLFTGKYTTSTGMVINEIRLNPAHHQNCFGHLLGRNDYESAYIGKWHMYAAELGNHYDPKNSYIPKGADRLGFDNYFAAYNFHHENYGAAAYYHLDSAEKHYCDKYEPDMHTDMAIEQITRLSQGDKPFAMFLSLGTPHDPWTPENVTGDCYERFADTEFELPPNYLPDNDTHADNWARLPEQQRKQLPNWMRCYYAMVANLDDNIGRLMAHIKSLGIEEDTIIVFTSDHGELFGAHGRRAKNIFYDEAVKIPFLIKHGDKLKGSNDTVLNIVDVMPTLLSMMNIEIPDEVEGRDYSEHLLSGTSTDDGALMMCTGPTAIFGDGQEWRGYKDKRYTYAVFKCDGQEHLYDNTTDPYQMNNLAENADFAELKAELKQKMYHKMSEIGDTFESNSYYEQNWVKDRLIIKTAKNN